MAKLKNPISSFVAQGGLFKQFTLRHSRKQTILENKPIPEDAKSLAQLSWRHMYQKAVALWHALSEAEQQDWESQARHRHMTGFAWFISQALKPNPGLYLPLQGGVMQGLIDMDSNPLSNILDPTNPQDPVSLSYLLSLLNFLSLTDTPADYTGHALKAVRVNAGENALEFATLVGGYDEATRVYHNANQSIPHNTWTTVAFSQESYDSNNLHNPVVNNSRLTCQRAGVYIAGALIQFAGNATGRRGAELWLNGITLIYDFMVGVPDNTTFSFAIATPYKLALNDYLTLKVYQNSGAPLNIESAARYNTSFWTHMVAL